MEKIKSFLRKWPKLYNLFQICYGRIHLLKEKILKINIDEKEEKRWERRHFYEGKDWSLKGYWKVRNHPATHFLLKEIEKFSPFSSILEIGCNCGPNMYLIAKKFPSVVIKGIDINPLAIQTGKELLVKEGISNAELFVGKAQCLQFIDKSFDIVFSKAVLSHIGPTKISKVIAEMLRVSKKALILIEYHEPAQRNETAALGIRLGYSYRWRRNYITLLKKIAPEAKIFVSRIPPEVWGSGWYIVKVIL